jgi:hypothetical protein
VIVIDGEPAVIGELAGAGATPGLLAENVSPVADRLTVMSSNVATPATALRVSVPLTVIVLVSAGIAPLVRAPGDACAPGEAAAAPAVPLATPSVTAAVDVVTFPYASTIAACIGGVMTTCAVMLDGRTRHCSDAGAAGAAVA